MLNLNARRVLVVGGGDVGVRKARALRDAGADVTLVAGAKGPAGRGDLAGINVLAADYSEGLVEGAFLVLACTDDAAVNSRIAADARRAGAIVNVADQPGECDFFVPAAFSDGPVVVAVGTGGAAPAFATALRDRLAEAIPPGAGRFAALLGELREEVRRKTPSRSDRRRIMRKLASQDTFDLFTEGGRQAVTQLAAKLIGTV